jgi:hypothetical protein
MTSHSRSAPLDGERRLTDWACDADDWTARRTHIRAHQIIDIHSRIHTAKSVLR